MFKNLLLGAVALIAFTSHAGIDDTYLSGLATAPFKQLTVAGGTYKDEATITARAETNLWLDGYKRDILVDAFAVSTARLALAGKVNRNLLEIGCCFF